MDPVTTPLKLSAAGLRVAGYVMESNLRVAQVLSRAAVANNPFLVRARVARSAPASAETAPAEAPAKASAPARRPEPATEAKRPRQPSAPPPLPEPAMAEKPAAAAKPAVAAKPAAVTEG